MENELVLICIIISIFIYNRTLDYYKVLPRNNIFVAVSVGIWMYISIKYNPWFFITGIILLNFLDRQIPDVNTI